LSVIVITACQYTRRDTLLTVPTVEDIKQRIETAIPGARADVEDFTGGGDHFRATVTAAAFAGRSRIEQHRLVYDIFQGEIGGPIHALSLKTQVDDAARAFKGVPAAQAGT
jgi:stress-induced morphogen